MLSEGEAQVPHPALGLRLLERIAPGDFRACRLSPWKVPCWPWTRAAGVHGLADVTWYCLGDPGRQLPGTSSSCPLGPGGVTWVPQGVWSAQSQVSLPQAPAGSHQCVRPVRTPHMQAFGSLSVVWTLHLSLRCCPLLGPFLSLMASPSEGLVISDGCALPSLCLILSSLSSSPPPPPPWGAPLSAACAAPFWLLHLTQSGPIVALYPGLVPGTTA